MLLKLLLPQLLSNGLKGEAKVPHPEDEEEEEKEDEERVGDEMEGKESRVKTFPPARRPKRCCCRC